MQATDRLPGSLIRTARAALAAPDPFTFAQRAATTDDIAAKLGPVHQTVLQFLRTHGAASASNPDILQAAGVTRARVAQVFADLSSQGLTDSQRLGRRVLYSPTDRTH